MTDRTRDWLRAAVLVFVVALAANLLGPDVGGRLGYAAGYWGGWVVAILGPVFAGLAWVAFTRWYRAEGASPTTYPTT